MSTKIFESNDVTGGILRKRNRAKSAAENEAMFEKVFREKTNSVSGFGSGLRAKIHSINKTFIFPDVVSRLNSSDPEERAKSLRKLIDWLSQRNAMNSGKYDMVDLVEISTKLFQQLKRFIIKSDVEEEYRVLELLEILSTHAKSAKIMISKNIFIAELYNILYNVQAEHQDQAAKILYNLTNKGSEFVKLFVKHNRPFFFLIKIFNRPLGTLYYPKNLFLHIANILDVFPVMGVKKGFFEIFYHRIHHKLPEYHMENMKCFIALMQSKKGFELFQRSGVINPLLKLITNRPTDFNFEYVLKCFSKALDSHEMQKICVPYLSLPLDITEIAKKSKDPVIQHTCVEIIDKLNHVKPFDTVIQSKCSKWLKKIKPAIIVKPVERESENTIEMDRLLKFLENASRSSKSASVMACKQVFVAQLYKILALRNSKHKEKAAQILANLTSGNRASVREFAKNNQSFEHTSRILKNRGIKPSPDKFWEHVCHLIRAFPRLSLKYGFFDISTKYIKREGPDFEKGPAQCLACLLQNNKDFELHEISNVLGIFLKFLSEHKSEPREFSNILTYILESMQSERLLEQMLPFSDLPSDIVQVAKSSRNPDVHMKAMDIIKKLYSVVPQDVHSKCLATLIAMKFEEEFVDYERQQFVNFLKARQNLYKSKAH